MRVQTPSVQGGGLRTGSAQFSFGGRYETQPITGGGVIDPIPEGCTGANTVPAGSSVAVIQQYVTNCPPDGTVCLAAGTYSFDDTDTYSITSSGKNFILKGAGIGQTIILDNKPSGAGLFSFVVPDWFRLSGMTIRHGPSGNNLGQNGGFIKIMGGGARVRVDHIKFDSLLLGPYLIVVEDCLGVFDQNVIVYALTGGGRSTQCRPLIGLPTFWGGAGADKGHASFARPTNYGTQDFWVFENNDFIGAPGSTGGADGAGDNHNGARMVIRRSRYENTNLAMHGTESGNNRGGRVTEVYQNQWTRTGKTDRYVIFRSGTGVVWGNDVTSPTGDEMAQGYAYLRLGNAGDWGAADSSSTRVTHHWGTTTTLVDSGTVDSAGVAALGNTLTDLSKSWTVPSGTPNSDCSSTVGGYGGCLYSVKVFRTPATSFTRTATGSAGSDMFTLTAGAPTFVAQHLNRYLYVQAGVNAGAWGLIKAVTDSTHVNVNVVQAWPSYTTTVTSGQWVIMFSTMIRFNSSNTLTFSDGDHLQGNIWFALAGESYEIWGPFGDGGAKVLDEPGTGQSAPLTGSPPNVTPKEPANNLVEKIHIWNNRRRTSPGDTWSAWNTFNGSHHLHASAVSFTPEVPYTPLTWPHPLRLTGPVSGDNDGGEVGTDGVMFP